MDLKNWQDSVEKWEKIHSMVRNRKLFTDPDGFPDFDVVHRCGYCEEFNKKSCCDPCVLAKGGFCFGFRGSRRGMRSILWRFVDTMRMLSGFTFRLNRYEAFGKERLWKMADELSAKMLKRIRQDDPRKIKASKPRNPRNLATK